MQNRSLGWIKRQMNNNHGLPLKPWTLVDDGDGYGHENATRRLLQLKFPLLQLERLRYFRKLMDMKRIVISVHQSLTFYDEDIIVESVTKRFVKIVVRKHQVGIIIVVDRNCTVEVVWLMKMQLMLE